MHVVLYAEGPGETGPVEMPPASAARSRISEDALGPAHVLTRRCIARAAGRDESWIEFQAPLFLPRGKPARGSQLLVPRTLVKLLTWTHPVLAPDLAIVLVDADGSTSRLSDLESTIAGRAMVVPPAIVAVAVQEFETWLLADLQPLRRITSQRIDALPDLEASAPGQAKHALLSHLATSPDEQQAARLEICRSCDLDMVERSSSSFRRYLGELRRVCATIA